MSFFNFDKDGYAALGSCSHCFHPAATDSGARTVKFSGIYFDSTVATKIRYQFPYRAIYFDTDGTLTGTVGGWTTPYWKHNDWADKCTNDVAYNGLVCDNTIQIRRVVFY